MSEYSELTSLYLELNRLTSINDYDKALIQANKILNKYPEEYEAFQCKIISLIQQDKHEDCLHQFKKNQNFAKLLLFEKAYCEYRLNRNTEAIATIESCDQQTLAMKELLVQILYRMERFEDALQLYRTIMRESSDDYGQERLTNMTAVIAAIQFWSGKNIEFVDIDEDTFELKYNHATYLIASGKIEEAIEKLLQAEEMVRESLNDDPDVTETELNEELAPIKVQLAYAYHIQGRMDQAIQIYQLVAKQRPNDAAVMAVVSNNIVCINRDQNIFDSKKKMKTATSDNLKHKLMKAQRHSVATNQSLLSYYANQGDLCRSLSQQLVQSYPLDDRPVLIHVAQLIKDKQISKAISFVEKYVTNNYDRIELFLCLCQLHLSQNSVSACCKLLEKLPESYLHRLGIVSTRIALLKSLENIDDAHLVFQQALQSYKNKKTSQYVQLLTTNAKFCLRFNRPQNAAELLEELRKLQPNDQRIIARLIHAYSQFDKTKAEKVSKSLKLSDTEFTQSEVDSLESAFLFGAKYMKRVGKTTQDHTPKSPHDKKVKTPDTNKTSKKKKKTKFPKNYDPNTLPDPERWLPKRERSYYRGRKKDKRTNIMRGPQGATSGLGDLDQSGRQSAAAANSLSPRADSKPVKSPNSNQNTSNPPTNQQKKPPSAGSKPPGNKGKKKKGGHW